MSLTDQDRDRITSHLERTGHHMPLSMLLDLLDELLDLPSPPDDPLGWATGVDLALADSGLSEASDLYDRLSTGDDLVQTADAIADLVDQLPVTGREELAARLAPRLARHMADTALRDLFAL